MVQNHVIIAYCSCYWYDSSPAILLSGLSNPISLMLYQWSQCFQPFDILGFKRNLRRLLSWEVVLHVMLKTLSSNTLTVLHTWWRHQMETFSALLALCAGNSLVPSQWPVTRSFDVFFGLRNGWVNNREPGDLRRNRAHYDVTVMMRSCSCFN